MSIKSRYHVEIVTPEIHSSDERFTVTDLDALLWAMLTRTDPKHSIQFIDGSWDSPADPALPPDRPFVRCASFPIPTPFPWSLP